MEAILTFEELLSELYLDIRIDPIFSNVKTLEEFFDTMCKYSEKRKGYYDYGYCNPDDDICYSLELFDTSTKPFDKVKTKKTPNSSKNLINVNGKDYTLVFEGDF